ncbi:Gti1/Pac2 family-domain-containing protein, partial [Cadophora sp. MPI-SDFR-AT-0126]
MASASPLSPTFFGHIASTQDALLLFEACLSGALNHVARRPHDRERVSLIKSGNVFIYEEHSSGIKRWTDGVPWSPSRILGNFLVYRELERPFPPGEKKRAMKRSKRSPGISKPEPFSGSETERSLIGSLVDSYGFKEEGLVKKTVSVTVGGVSHHLVSYYTVADVMNNKFTTPSKDPRFQHITPRPDLITKQNFRTPI